MKQEIKDKVFKLVQEYLKNCSTIIWGSGATIPFGMPSMEDLKKDLELKGNDNLEITLSKIDNQEKLDTYCKKIFKIINEVDCKLKKKILAEKGSIFEDLEKVIEYFHSTNSNKLDIITTNYDCVLEYFCAYYSYPFTDGFTGRELSEFNEHNFRDKKNNCKSKKYNFKDKKHINLLKVHGSLRWFDNRYSYYNSSMQAIYPTPDKYSKAHEDPFRTLIQKSDNIIKNSKSFLVIGFGFNDAHLTPKLEQKVQEGSNLVIITKKATEKTLSIIKKANNVVLIEEDKGNQSKFTYTEDKGQKSASLEEVFWNIKGLNLILGQNKL